jgi:NADPH:quinone reductase-like Zn-dependent oxidoreductase
VASISNRRIFLLALAYEAAVVVEAVGPDVDKIWVGKRVAIAPSFVHSS